jgi:DNA-binding transcriptional MerR regulator
MATKRTFKLAEVCRQLDLPPYVLRYWETEFKELAPPKSRSDQRMYRRRDVEVVLAIKRLLYEERFTIEGARRRLAEIQRGQREEARRPPSDAAALLARVRTELGELKALLARG